MSASGGACCVRGLASTKASHSAGTGRPAASSTLRGLSPSFSTARRNRPRPCCSICTTPAPSLLWLWPCAPSKWVWNSKLSMSYSPCPVAKQTSGWWRGSARRMASAIAHCSDDRGVGEPHAERAGARRIAIDVDGLDVKLRVEAPKQLQHGDGG